MTKENRIVEKSDLIAADQYALKLEKSLEKN